MIIRLAGIALGAISLLLLWAQLGVLQYKQFFMTFLMWLEDLVIEIPLDVLRRALVDPALGLLRSFGWLIPELTDQWRFMFVLSWLLMGAAARNGALRYSHLTWNEWRETQRHATPSGATKGNSPAQTVVRLSLAFACALFGSVIGDLFGILGVLAAFFMFFVLAGTDRLFIQLFAFFLFVSFGVGVYVSRDQIVISYTDFLVYFYLWILGAFVLFAAFFLLELWMRRVPETGDIEGARFSRAQAVPRFNFGLDVLGTMGLAIFLALLFADPPLL